MHTGPRWCWQSLLVVVVAQCVQAQFDEGYGEGYGGYGGYGGGYGGGPPAARPGIVNIDHISFDKIVGSGSPVFVQFGMPFQVGEDRDAFPELAIATSGSPVLCASVSVSETEDDPGHRLAVRFGVAHAEMPVYMLFPAGKKEGVTYNGDKASSLEMKQFLEKQGIFLGGAGTLREFDRLATEFVIDQATRKEVLARAEEMKKQLKGDDVIKAKNYILVMNKIQSTGDDFVPNEIQRVERLMKEKSIKEEKRQQFEWRVNVLKSFGSRAE